MRRLLLLLFAVPLLAQAPKVEIQLPQRDQITIEDLQTQIANCTITAANEQKYEAKLIARIHELEKQVADLKAPPKVSEKAK